MSKLQFIPKSKISDSVMMMRTITILSLAVIIFSCNAKQNNNNAVQAGKQFKHKITLRAVDTANLQACFRNINRLLEKQHPELFKDPPGMGDTANPHYITNLLKTRVITYGGEPVYNGDPVFAVLKTDTAEVNKMLNNPAYKSFFPGHSTFAYSAETAANKGLLDLFCLAGPSIILGDADLKKVDFTFTAFGANGIGIYLNDAAQRKVQSFSAGCVNRRIAFIVNGAVYAAPLLKEPFKSNYIEIDPKMTRDEVLALLGKER